MRQQAPARFCLLQVPALGWRIILFLLLQAALQSGPTPAATCGDVRDRLQGILQQAQAAGRVDTSLVEDLKALQQSLQSDQQLSAPSGSAALLRAQEELGSVIQQFQGDVDARPGQEAWEPGMERLGRLAESLATSGSLPNHTGGQEGGAPLLHALGPHSTPRCTCPQSPCGLAVSSSCTGGMLHPICARLNHQRASAWRPVPFC